MTRHRFPIPLSMSLRLMALMRPSVMSLGATQCAPALAYASATSAMRSAEGAALIVPSSWRIPQCPCEVYSHRQTSVAMNNVGKSARSFLMARITGPCGSSAGVPRGSFSHFKGTPKRMTLLRPFCTRGPMRLSSRSMPHRHCPGNDGMSTQDVGSSITKMGYMNMDLSSPRRDCHWRESGWL